MKLPDDIRKFFQQQGSIGAAKRYAHMSAAERQELARRAAQSRWKKVKQTKAKKVKSEAQQ